MTRRVNRTHVYRLRGGLSIHYLKHAPVFIIMKIDHDLFLQNIAKSRF